MSILLKKIGGKEYAYLAYRAGVRVVHKYLGPVESNRVAKKISEMKASEKVREEYRSLFWDTDLKNIHIRRNASYIIERILEMGDLSALKWIQGIYPARKIIEVIETSRKISQKSKNFWQIWFGTADAS
ncbi:MAG: hypothetical protein HZA10_09260 [Nitrospirae bacterium]|nr:hypothetical protein [Nitrospirota bacterium]